MVNETKKTDAEIHHDVLEELRWDTRVTETDVGVEVDDGVVTLTGTVESWAARLAAVEAAHRVAGVLDVANEIVVRLPGSMEIGDVDIAHAAREALQRDVFVPSDRITTTVSNGVVVLEGTVERWVEYDDAARAIAHLPGVREVKNHLVVDPPAIAKDTVRSAIEGALARHAAHAARRVGIAIADGTVILSGAVPSWAERRAIEGAVRGTRGVGNIDNRLRIHA
jgi:osmotically-inducible protein OsmY